MNFCSRASRENNVTENNKLEPRKRKSLLSSETHGFVNDEYLYFICVLRVSFRTKASVRANISRSIRLQFLFSLLRILFLTCFCYKAVLSKNGLRSPL